MPVSRYFSIDDLANYHQDTVSSLRLYFDEINPGYMVLFAGERPKDVAKKLENRINETDMRSVLALMAGIEAVFRLDYEWRRYAKKADAVSIDFRQKKSIMRLDDIWNTWRINHPNLREEISQLRGAMHFRHWLAHGKFWKPGQKYDFQSIYLLAQAVFSNFPLFK